QRQLALHRSPPSAFETVRRDGRCLSTTKHRTHDGGVVVLVSDVTEAKERSRLALQSEKLRALGQLASGVAHDPNQSLAIIAGYSEQAREILARPEPDLAAAQDSLALVGRAALDGGEIVERLLTFARGRPEGESSLVDLAELLIEVSKLTAPRWRDAAQAE